MKGSSTPGRPLEEASGEVFLIILNRPQLANANLVPGEWRVGNRLRGDGFRCSNPMAHFTPLHRHAEKQVETFLY